VVNFLIGFPKKIQAQRTVLAIFRRLFHSFPMFRKNLEDPVIMVLVNIGIRYTEIRSARTVRLKAYFKSERIGYN